jgi:hypothetical protein
MLTYADVVEQDVGRLVLQKAPLVRWSLKFLVKPTCNPDVETDRFFDMKYLSSGGAASQKFIAQQVSLI